MLAPYLRNFASYDRHLWNTCKRIISPGFLLFLNFDCWGQWWGKRAKTGLAWQKIMSVTLHISGSIHHDCKMTSLYAFFHFSKILISRLLKVKGGVKGSVTAKHGPKWQKIMSVSLCISRTTPYMIVVSGTHV